MISVRFYGPCSEELANEGIVDRSVGDAQKIWEGRGETRALAASSALSALSESAYAEHLDTAANAVMAVLAPEDFVIEADGESHFVYCTLRVDI